MKFHQNLHKKNKDAVISHELRSHEYEKKLALIVNKIEEVSEKDLKFVNIKKNLGLKKLIFILKKIGFINDYWYYGARWIRQNICSKYCGAFI